MKKIRLTIITQYHRDDQVTKKWEWFNPIVFYWFKHRKNGPAIISPQGVEYYENGKRFDYVSP